MNRLLSLGDLTPDRARRITFLVSDVDETLTISEKIRASVLQAFEELTAAGIRTVLATGRSAGFGQTLATYFPHVEGVIAENGGVFCLPSTDVKLLIEADPAEVRDKLREGFETLRNEFSRIRPSYDSFGRMTDFSIPRETVDNDDLPRLTEAANEIGLGMVYSSVHIHLYYEHINKAKAIEKVVVSQFGVARENIAVIGDSPNDGSMFEPGLFGLSAGVANVLRYEKAIRNVPEFVCQQSEGEGFVEFVGALLDARR